MASIRDVAKKANVGPATVSRVLNSSGYVSEESRRRIEQAMMELDYTPNELARICFWKEDGDRSVTGSCAFPSVFLPRLWKKPRKPSIVEDTRRCSAIRQKRKMQNWNIWIC